MTYSADGECILAAGKSVNICIYHVKEGILLKKFEITQNRSLDGLNDFINRRNLTEFGNMALVESRQELEGGDQAIQLPGVLKGDMSSRSLKPEVNVSSVRFSPSGVSFAAACTEGLMIYSLDKGIVFDPFQLSVEVTPKAVREHLQNQEYSPALLMALKLNEMPLIHECIERIPMRDGEWRRVSILSREIEVYEVHCLSACGGCGGRQGQVQGIPTSSFAAIIELPLYVV